MDKSAHDSWFSVNSGPKRRRTSIYGVEPWAAPDRSGGQYMPRNVAMPQDEAASMANRCEFVTAAA
jgi:hypothetical protein